MVACTETNHERYPAAGRYPLMRQQAPFEERNQGPKSKRLTNTLTFSSQVHAGIMYVMVSGVCNQAEVEKLRNTGIEVITKPFHVEEFMNKMMELIP